MISELSALGSEEKATYRTTTACMSDRLAEKDTIAWALDLNVSQRGERLAIIHLLDPRLESHLKEPWATTWRLIEESWSTPPVEASPSIEIYRLRDLLRSRDYSSAVINRVVGLVAPRLKVEPIAAFISRTVPKPHRPKTFNDLLSAELRSGPLVDLNVLELSTQEDVDFLTAIANGLDSAVTHGLDVARRLGQFKFESQWSSSRLNRAYYTEPGTQPEHRADPDQSNRGIAPPVKLLSAVVDQLAKVNLPAAVSFVARWRLSTSSVHMRLWAAAARNPALVPTEQVSEFLIGINDELFWSLHDFPEVAELRAIRFKELDNISRISIAKRLQKGPPRRHWPQDADPKHVKAGKRYSAVRELKRVEFKDGELPEAQKKWLKTNIIEFPELGSMESQQGFPEGFPVMQTYCIGPDSKYDAITGIERLLALESAFSTSRTSWDDDPAERAKEWLDQASNIDEIFNDLESTGNAGVDFPRVWERFGWALGRVRRSVPDRTDVI